MIALCGFSPFFRYVPRSVDVPQLVKVSTMPPTSELTVERDIMTGAVVDFTEVTSMLSSFVVLLVIHIPEHPCKITPYFKTGLDYYISI